MPRGTKSYFMGYEFDSKPECERAKYLYSLEAEGVISGLILDKQLLLYVVSLPYVLPAIKPLRPKPIKVAGITYTPDYRYEWNGVTVLEDYKDLRKVKRRVKGRIVVKKVVHIERDSRLRIKLLHPLLPPMTIFRVCYDITADPDAQSGYYYK